MIYLDPSAWVKRYVRESGSAWVHPLFDSGERSASSALGYLEVVAALPRRLPEPNWTSLELQFDADWQEMARLPVTSDLIYRAAGLTRQYKLRGADVLHLATALDLQTTLTATGESVVLVAADAELLTSAQAAGLPVENPLRPANRS